MSNWFPYSRGALIASRAEQWEEEEEEENRVKRGS